MRSADPRHVQLLATKSPHVTVALAYFSVSVGESELTASFALSDLAIFW